MGDILSFCLEKELEEKKVQKLLQKQNHKNYNHDKESHSVPFPFTGKINPAFDSLALRKALTHCPYLLESPECEILVQGRNKAGKISLALSEERKIPVVIKEFRTQGIDKLKSLFLPSKAFKAWEGGMALIQKGIPTPLPVAYLEKRRKSFLEQSFFLSQWVEETSEIRHLIPKYSSSKLEALLSALAQHLAYCHKKGVLHRDLSDGNILVKKEENEKKGLTESDPVIPSWFKFYLIDTNRIRLQKRVSLFCGLKSLIRLGIPPSKQLFFLKKYLGTPKIKTIYWLWYKINKKMYTEWIEIKKKLGLKKLSQKLRIQ